MSDIQALITEHLAIWTGADNEKKSGRGRASGNAASVYGVKKLRELILELAVRGKLVPQDASDEPASELLKRIAAEKAKLIKEGKIKAQKPLAVIGDDEKPFELPSGWAYSRLGDVVEIIRGITFPGSEKTKIPEVGRVACLRTTNVQDKIEWSDLLYIREEFVSREDQILMPQDIVMSMANSRELVGKVALVDTKINQKTSFGGFLGVLRPFLIEPRFLMALLRTPHTREALIDSASQTTNIANISLVKLRPLFFAIPPLAEQHRIVAKVDELMTLCDQLENQHSNAIVAHEKLVSYLLNTLTQSQDAAEFNESWQRIAANFDTLFSTETSIDALKQTVLQLAVMGKLVPQDANDEPASELLKRIQVEKARLVQGEGLKTQASLNIDESEKYLSLPSSWDYYRLGNLAKFIDYRGRTPEKIESGVPLITAKNVRFGFISREPYEFVSEAEYNEWMTRGFPRINDMLFTTEAPLGNVAIIDITEKFALAQRVICLQLHLPEMAQFLKLLMMSKPFQELLYEQATGMTATGIKASKLKELPMVIPPLAEQNRIVAKVDELMAICDQLKTRITTANQLQQKLADVLVGQAVA